MIWDKIKLNNDGLIPAIVQDAENHEVLMMAYMNEEALKKSLETGLTHFWSRSRKKLWMKGETSGHMQKIQRIWLDCDGDTLLIEVIQIKAACHTGYRSCFYRSIDIVETKLTEKFNKLFDIENVYGNKATVLREVYNAIEDRRLHPCEGSYTNYLFDKGIDKILKKIGEESAEVIIAAKNRIKSEVIYEIADLIYHIMVVLVEQDIDLDDIFMELENRRVKNKSKDLTKA